MRKAYREMLDHGVHGPRAGALRTAYHALLAEALLKVSQKLYQKNETLHIVYLIVLTVIMSLISIV